MNQKTFSKIIFIAVIIILAGVIGYLVLINASPTTTGKFKLLDGNTRNPISNQEIYICDDSVKIDYVGEYPLARFCDGEHRRIINKLTTDSSGIFAFDVKKINIRPPSSIVIDTGKSDDRWGKVEIERSDGLGHTYNPSYLRVLSADKDGHIISNKFYNLDSKEVKEIFTADKSERNYGYDTIDLVVFQKETQQPLPPAINDNPLILNGIITNTDSQKVPGEITAFEFRSSDGRNLILNIEKARLIDKNGKGITYDKFRVGDSVTVTTQRGDIFLSSDFLKPSEIKIIQQ